MSGRRFIVVIGICGIINPLIGLQLLIQIIHVIREHTCISINNPAKMNGTCLFAFDFIPRKT